jgi:hypothetical protein
MARNQKAGLSAPQREVIDVLAHILAASEISKIEGFGDFFNRYVQETLTLKQKAIWRELMARTKQVKGDIADMLEAERA